MDKLSAAKRLSIVRHYLSGESYDEVAAKTGVGKGTVTNVVAELKAGKFTEAADIAGYIEELRELSIDLKHWKLGPGQCAIGLAVLNRINQCGLDPADIARWPLILKSAGTEAEIQDFIHLVYGIQKVQQTTGLSLNELKNKAEELENKVAALEPESEKLDGLKKEVADLTKQRDELAGVVSKLVEQYNFLDPRVKDLLNQEQAAVLHIKEIEPKGKKAEASLAALKENVENLQNIGLSFEELADFTQKVQTVAQLHSIKPKELQDRFFHELGNLEKGLGLETLIKSREQELNKKEKNIAETKKELETTKATVVGLEKERAALEACIKETREKVGQEILKIIPLAKDAINKLVEEMRAGCDGTLSEINRLSNEALEVGKEIGGYERIIKDNEWLNELQALVRGEQNIEAGRVKIITLTVMRGAAVWLDQHRLASPELAPVFTNVLDLIKEIEKWKV